MARQQLESLECKSGSWVPSDSREMKNVELAGECSERSGKGWQAGRRLGIALLAASL